MFNSTPDDLDMHVIYDVSHNIAKVVINPYIFRIYLKSRSRSTLLRESGKDCWCTGKEVQGPSHLTILSSQSTTS